MNKSQITDKTRRAFLSDCGKMTAIGAMSSILNMTMTNKILAARAPGSITDYKALVCVFLNGGCDSFQMLMPGVNAFDSYTERRKHLAVRQEDQHLIKDHRKSGSDYHVHQSMPEVANMFENRDLSLIANIGTLVEPLTKTEFINKSKKVPLGIASHFDQTLQWQTSIPDERGGSVGWFGRMADVINDAANNNGTVSMSLSPSGSNTLQQGRETTSVNLEGGANAMELYAESPVVNSAVDSQLEGDYKNLLQQHYNHVRRSAIDQNQALQELERETRLDTIFPDTALGGQLLQVAKYIKVHGILGLNRQTFFVNKGGWDMHTGLNSRIGGQLGELSGALNAFNSAMKEIGYHDKVVTYTASDFGRTLTGNGSGTDHAWGSNQIVMGGPIKGGRVLGRYPNLSEGSSTDLNTRGTQMPVVSVDHLHASLAKWFGVNNDSEMEAILPNIRNFYSANETRFALPALF